MLTNNIIEVRNFTKQYGDFTAVDHISFDVEEGTIFAFLGPNGAGKSTTINTLCTIIEKTEGEMRINGHDVAEQKALVRKDIGIVFQESTLDTRLTIEENLKLHCDFYQVPEQKVKERIDFVLDLVDLVDWRNSTVGALSGGMKRRVEIARGLVHFPRVLFLDEPTTGLDPQTRANIWGYITKLQKEQNITIFLTTHYMDEAEICDKIAIMDHGKIVAYDTAPGLKEKYTKDSIKLKVASHDPLEAYLHEHELEFVLKNEYYTIYPPTLSSGLDLITQIKDSILDLEVNKGTLNDVFLNITGREIRG